jgi:Holliday junction resolvasome RuvABC endonuclease subunit
VIVCGIDSAETSGYAVVEAGPRERLITHGTFVIRRGGDVEQAVAALTEHRPDVVAIEEPFIRANPHTGLALAVLLGRWLQGFERQGIATTRVLASTWQIAILSGLIDRTSNREQRKKAARTWARSVFAVDLSEDAADAAGIACWAARRASMDAKTRSGRG